MNYLHGYNIFAETALTPLIIEFHIFIFNPILRKTAFRKKRVQLLILI